jgi:hypothetical protein
MTLYNLEALVMVLVSGAVVIWGIRTYQKRKLWYDLFMVIIACLWMALYVYVLFATPHNAAWFGQTFVRPLNILTWSLISVLRYALLTQQRMTERRNGHR